MGKKSKSNQKHSNNTNNKKYKNDNSDKIDQNDSNDDDNDNDNDDQDILMNDINIDNDDGDGDGDHSINNDDDNENDTRKKPINQQDDNIKKKSRNNNTTTNANKEKVISISKSMSFTNLTKPALSNCILDYINNEGFINMTPVQAATIPQLLNYKDVAVQAVTGSGKTLAFLIPVLEILLKRRLSSSTNTDFKKQQIGSLILSPTRELALQTYNVAKKLCIYCKQPEPLLLVGGGNSGSSNSGSSNSTGNNSRPVTLDIQNFKLLGSNLIIGTPGRVDDILNRYSIIDTSELECLILDEADVLLNMGFSTTLTNILSRLPKMRRTGLFSATQTTTSSSTLQTNNGIKDLMHRMGMRNPIWIDVAVTSKLGNTTTNDNNTETSIDNDKDNKNNNDDNIIQKYKNHNQQQATPISLNNYYIVTKQDEKLSRLYIFLKNHLNEKIIVFFLTCACVDFYGTALQIIFNKYNKFNNNNKANKKNDDNNDDTSNNHNYIELLHGKMVQKRREKSMERFRNTIIKSNNNDNDNTTNTDNDNNDNNNKDSNNNNIGVALFCTDVAARGLDVTDINWVIQFDAPQDPSFFVHRVGRAARAGRIGNSLLLVTNKEEAYIDLLRMRKIPINYLSTNEICCPLLDSDDNNKDTEKNIPEQIMNDDDIKIIDDEEDIKKLATNNMKNSNDKQKQPQQQKIRIIRTASNPNILLDDILIKLRTLVMNDRDILEKGTKAFTSYIRAYKEHHCGFIFRFASLDLGLLATSFCLLRLPKMPELRDVILKHKGKLPNFIGAGPEVDIFAIPYKDKVREIARQKRLKEIMLAGGKNAKEIKAERRKAEKESKVLERREQAIDKGRNPDKKRGRHAQLVDEWDDLAKEERLYKKLRKKKITEDEYNYQMHQT